jgi:hypothetical protein
MTEKSNSRIRSLQQNNYLWGVVVEESLQFYKKNEGALVLDILDFIKADLTPAFIHELQKMGFNRSQSTTKLDTKGMEEYMLKIRVYMAQKHGLDISPPNEPPLEQLIIGKNYEN